MKKRYLTCVAITIAAFGLPMAAQTTFTGTATMSVQSFLNLSNGSSNISGADILWSGTATPSSCSPSCALSFQAGAKGLNLGTSFPYSSIDGALLSQFASAGMQTPIPSSSLTTGDIFAVEGITGNFTKAMVTANTGSTLSFQYTTYLSSGSGGGAGAPTITNVLNNSSLIPSGFPNSGLTPSTLFHVFGTNMATPGTVPVLQDSTKGLPSMLNGTSISVTVNGTKVQPAIYYSSPTDVAGVLPANTPTGSGTLTITYNNQSANANIQVVATAFGFDIYNGAAVATDAVSGALITYTNSAQPGQTLLFWGTGVGADPNHSDTVGGANDSINVPVTFYVGGVQAKVVFTGALFYPGVQGFGVTIPDGAPAGCFVPVVAVTGSGASQAVSSIPTIPVMPSGGTCSDSLFGINGGSLGTLGSQTTVKSGSILVGQGTSGTTVADIAIASFSSVPGSSYANSGGLVSLGGCVLTETNSNLILPGLLLRLPRSMQGASRSRAPWARTVCRR